MWHAGPRFLNQGSNSCRLQWKQSPNHWTTREVLVYMFGEWIIEQIFWELFFFFLIFFFVCDMWNPISLARDRTHICCIGSMESKPLYHQGSLQKVNMFMVNLPIPCPSWSQRRLYLEDSQEQRSKFAQQLRTLTKVSISFSEPWVCTPPLYRYWTRNTLGSQAPRRM